MSTTAVPPKPKAKLPSLNPVLAPNAFCKEKTCLSLMEPKAGIDKKSGEFVLYYVCPKCNYACVAQAQHLNGICVPVEKLDLR
jgi:hypothetical protein